MCIFFRCCYLCCTVQCTLWRKWVFALLLLQFQPDVQLIVFTSLGNKLSPVELGETSYRYNSHHDWIHYQLKHVEIKCNWIFAAELNRKANGLCLTQLLHYKYWECVPVANWLHFTLPLIIIKHSEKKLLA